MGRGADSAPNPSLDAPQDLADRYYAMAEEMNSRGAMELAVPFYRQALALLMAERQQLQAPLPADQLHGLLAAAEHWEQQQPSPAAALPNRTNLEHRIAELQQDLSSDSAPQVLAALRELEATHQGLSAEGWGLRGKAAIVLGQGDEAVEAFREARRLEPQRPEHAINEGGALLACGAVAESLEVLRGVWQQHSGQLSAQQDLALLRNLCAAETLGGDATTALQLRQHWLQTYPQSEPVEQWLQWAQQGLAAEQSEGARAQALALLQSLHAQQPQHRGVMEALAEALETDGRYREASLLYRSLLRPEAASPQG